MAFFWFLIGYIYTYKENQTNTTERSPANKSIPRLKFICHANSWTYSFYSTVWFCLDLWKK